MSATQELSQWMLGESTTAPTHDTQSIAQQKVMNYTPGHSGYIDLGLGNEDGSQIEITPFHAAQTELFSESKRFAEPETPIHGGKTGMLARDSSGSSEFKTPQLPPNPFANPFGPIHEAGEGIMGLTQVFKATQAASSPMLLHRLPSSQRPSPHVLERTASELPSDLISEPSPGGIDLRALSPMQIHSSPIGLTNSQDRNSSKRDNEEDGLSIDGETNQVDTSMTGSNKENVPQTKKRRISFPDETTDSTPRVTRNTHRTRSQQAALTRKPMMVDNEADGTEDETEHEDDTTSPANDESHLEDSEADKENRLVPRSQAVVEGQRVTRPTRSSFQQAIPFSSSPSAARAIPGRIPKHNPIQNENLSEVAIQNSSAIEAVEDVAIADSQSSQKPAQRRLIQHVTSSNDSKRVIPQSQVARPKSSANFSSTAPDKKVSESQQTVSPPESSPSRARRQAVATESVNQRDNSALREVPMMSPQSSPPQQEAVKQQIHSEIDHNAERDHDDTDEELGNVRARQTSITQSIKQLGRTPANKATRSTSTIPETAYNSRYNRVPSASGPNGSNPFAEGEAIEYSFLGTANREQRDDYEATSIRSAGNSFASRRTDSVQASPIRKSPRKPKAFSAMQGNTESQEQDSLELGLFDTQDQNIRDEMARLQGPCSSPPPPERKRRRLIRKEPVRLDMPSSIEEPENVISAKRQPSMEDGQVPRSEELTTDTLPEQTAGKAPAPAFESPAPDQEADTEPIPFLDMPVKAPKTMKTYGGKSGLSKRKRQASSIPAQQSEIPAATAPLVKRGRGRPRKSAANVVTTKEFAKQESIVRSGSEASDLPDAKRLKTQAKRETPKRETFNSSTATPHSESSEEVEDSKVNAASPFSTRVFAKFNGTPPGFYAATCISSYKGETEMKYNVRFDDDTYDEVGEKFIKTLLFLVGDEVKVDRRSLRASVFVVTGYGEKIHVNDVENDNFPLTDAHGHQTIKLIEKTNGKRKPESPQVLDIPVTEIFWTIGMWSSVKKRDYIHTAVKKESPLSTVFKAESLHVMTPTTSLATSMNTSPRSKRGNSLLNLNRPSTAGVLEFKHTPSRTAFGMFKDVVFVLTKHGTDKERERLHRFINNNGGQILEDFTSLFSKSIPRYVSAEDEGEDNGNKKDISQQHSLQLLPQFHTTKLALLVANDACATDKYFQALVLGIPCISSRWIEDCRASGSMGNWQPYLLSSGQSAYLGIQASQQLQFTRKELADNQIRLKTIISRRQQWLLDSSVMLVGSGEDNTEDRMKAFVFFAQALGAIHVTAARSVEDAEQHLTESLIKYDWICIDNTVKTKGSGKAGKRTSMNASTSKAFRVLKTLTEDTDTKVIGSDLVVESIVVGSLVDW